jgi:hypothetical protein
MNRDSHQAHDPFLVAQLAADDLTGSERAAAERLVSECPRCAELLADLRAITSATSALPPPARTRDFRLTPADAARLRSPWRRWLGGIAQPRFAFVQPLGAGLATLGLAGLLIGILPNLAMSSATSGSAPAPPAAQDQATAAPASAPSILKSAPENAPTAGPSVAPTAAPSAAPSVGIVLAPSAEPAASAAPSAAQSSAAPLPAPSSVAPSIAAAPVGTGGRSSTATASPVIISVPQPPASAAAPINVAGASPSGGSDAAQPARTPGVTGGTGFGATSSATPDAGTAQSAPSNQGGAPSGGSAPGAPETAPSAEGTPGLGVTTGIAPRDRAGTNPGSGLSPFLILSVALFLGGLVLLVARRTAVRSTR